MEISFETKDLREICENTLYCESILGIGLTLELQKRLTDIISANDLSDIKVFLVPRNHGFYSINLDSTHNFVFVSNHVKTVSHQQLKEITRIKILYIGKTNEGL